MCHVIQALVYIQRVCRVKSVYDERMKGFNIEHLLVSHHFRLLLIIIAMCLGRSCVAMNMTLHITHYAGDENILRIGFDMTAYSVMESEGELSVCVSAYGGAGNEVFEIYMYPRDVTTQGRCIVELYLLSTLMTYMHISKCSCICRIDLQCRN